MSGPNSVCAAPSPRAALNTRDADTRPGSGDALAASACITASHMGVAVNVRTGDSVQMVRQRAFEQMADQAGLSAAARSEFVQRAQTLDGGGLNAPAGRAGAAPRALSTAEAQAALQSGRVVVAPTLAQEGLLRLIQAQDSADPLPTGLPPSGASTGLVLPTARNVVEGVPARAGVTPEVANAILQRVAQGLPPFDPAQGQVGRVSWFVTQGDPYVGNTAGKSVVLPVEVSVPPGTSALHFGEAQLLEIYNRQLPAATAQAEAQLRAQIGKTQGEPLSNTNLRQIARNASRIAELGMWTEVGETVRASNSGVGRVTLENSRFSRAGNGEFTLTSRAENVRLPQGAAAQLVETIRTRATPAEQSVVEAAERLAAQEKWSGRVQGVFRVGGKVLIVVGLATDAYRIYTAEDKVKTTVEVAGGWAGAAAAGGAFATWAAPVNATGPWGWAGYGLGTLVAGGVGYFAGSNATRLIYELTVEGRPLEIGP